MKRETGTGGRIFAAAIWWLAAGVAQATLHDRGGGLLYDDVLDVTWLQDANYARTSGFHPTGKMSWAEASKWVDTLSYHDPVRKVDHTGWRLPRVKPVNGKEFQHQFRLDGSTDEGYNILSLNSEFSYMYYVNLGLNGWWTRDGGHPPTFGVMKSWTAVWSGQADVGPVKNLQSDGYYCGSPGQPFPSPAVWIFTTAEGNQRDGLRRPDAGFAWAIHDGDLAAAVAQSPSVRAPASIPAAPRSPDKPSGRLYDMGGGLLYDAVLDVTWLQDADYARTSGFKPNGKMPWADAVKWVSELVYHDPLRKVDIRGWRLPKVRPVAGDAFNGRFCFDGSSDEGYNVTSPRSELSYMFHVNLGLKSYYSPAGARQDAKCGAAGNGKSGYVVNVGPVRNLKSHIYWSGSSVEPYSDRNAWIFDATFGYQNFYNKNDMLSPWPVHDGNVTGLAPDASRACAVGDVPAITVVAAPVGRAFDTYKDSLAGIQVELPLDESVSAEDKARLRKAMEEVVGTPGLVAFWLFGENAGHPRQSILVGAPLPLEEVGGPIPRVRGGSFSGSSAEFDGAHYFRLPRAKIGALDIGGPDAQVSMFAVVKLAEINKWGGTIAGIWSEGKGANDDTGTRQYALLFNMPAYGGSRQLTPHISAEGGVSRRADGSALPWCVDYAATRSELPVGKWVSVGFTYDGRFIRAYLNGVLEERPMDAERDKRTDRYFTAEGPAGGPRGMNPYYHGRGIFRYDATEHGSGKIAPADFTVGARYAGGNMLGEAFKGRMAGLAVFNRALSPEAMKRLHEAADLGRLE